jgi:hypothetical protein
VHDVHIGQFKQDVHDTPASTVAGW